jgi:SAM-dependent methyltransferase
MSRERGRERDFGMSAYDQLPYTSLAYPRTHPDHLFAMARSFGLAPARVESCRVLEIGCGSGGNLVAMAESLPGARLVGVDPSATEIARGQALAARVGVENLTLRAGFLEELDEGLEGSFDYVIAHGVLSWVAPEVRRSLLEQARARLAPDGVFYASYNVLPGWYLRGAVRGMMQRHVEQGPPEAQVLAARGLLDWLSRRVGRDGAAFRALLDEELARLASADDAYLFHELLEEHNHPLWFREFASEASAAGLAWIGEADPAANVSALASPRAHAALRAVAGDDPLRVEEHFDYLRARTFRASLLAHAHHARRDSTRWEGLYVASRGRDAALLEDAFIDDPRLEAALAELAAAWPDALPFEALGVTAEQLAPLHAAGLVELRARALGLARPPFRAPRTSALARLQAAGHGPVTNLRHEPLPLTSDEREGLLRLDEAMWPRLARLGLLREA